MSSTYPAMANCSIHSGSHGRAASKKGNQCLTTGRSAKHSSTGSEYVRQKSRVAPASPGDRPLLPCCRKDPVSSSSRK
eukprot:952895-Pyramimonas_sp.AAC.1